MADELSVFASFSVYRKDVV